MEADLRAFHGLVFEDLGLGRLGLWKSGCLRSRSRRAGFGTAADRVGTPPQLAS
jgi:hypothetical protein